MVDAVAGIKRGLGPERKGEYRRDEALTDSTPGGLLRGGTRIGRALAGLNLESGGEFLRLVVFHAIAFCPAGS